MFSKPSALLVDYDNIASKFESKLSDNILNWIAWFERGCFDPEGGKRRFVLKRCYWNAMSHVRRKQFEAAGFDVRECRAFRNKQKGSSADFDITIDAIELRHAMKGLKEVIILSFDSDFLSALVHLKIHKVDAWTLVEGDTAAARNYRKVVRTVIERKKMEEGLAFDRFYKPPKKKAAKAAPAVKSKAALPSPKTVTARATPRVPPKAHTRTVVSEAPKPPPAEPVRAPITAGDKPLVAAADHLAQAAAAQSKLRITRKWLMETLRDFPNFRTTGRDPWLGCISFPGLATRLAEVSGAFEFREVAPGVRALIFLADVEEPVTA